MAQRLPCSLFSSRMKSHEESRSGLEGDWPDLFPVMDLQIYVRQQHGRALLGQHILNTCFLDLRSFKWLLGEMQMNVFTVNMYKRGCPTIFGHFGHALGFVTFVEK